jgi:hypothetical protein
LILIFQIGTWRNHSLNVFLFFLLAQTLKTLRLSLHRKKNPKNRHPTMEETRNPTCKICWGLPDCKLCCTTFHITRFMTWLGKTWTEHLWYGRVLERF